MFDYTRKCGVEHAEIVLPLDAAKLDINWARDRQQLWNAADDFSPAALERACARALALQSFSYRAVRAFIETPDTAPAPALDLAHDNLRGPDFQ